MFINPSNENLSQNTQNSQEQQIKLIVKDSQNSLNQNDQLPSEYSIMKQQIDNDKDLKTLVLNLKIRFSNQLKHNWIKLNQTRTYAKNVLQHLAFILCEPIIPNNSTVQFAFKSGQNSGQCIGICGKNLIQEQNLFNDDVYFINDFGFANFDSETFQENNLKDVFDWRANDIIHVEVDTKIGKIKWTNVSTNESHIVNIKCNQSFYPFVGLCIQSSMEIIDNI